MKNLLFLHGALGSKQQFKKIEEELKSSFEVHSINFSGHGGEPVPQEPLSIEMFSSDVLNWLQDNRIKEVDIFGYSMGGYVALYIARNFPGKTRRIFTLATKFDWTEEISAREVKMLDSAKIKEKVPAFAKELSARHFPESWEKVMNKTAEMMINLGRKNTLLSEDYSKIENDVLVGVGDRDKMVTLEETIEVYRQLKNGRLLVMPGTPHPLEQVDGKRLASEIKNFFV